LGDLAAQVQSLLERVPAVSLRHPELLGYTDADLLLYQEQLEVVGRWLLKQGSQWNSFRVDCLTDGVRGKGAGHCEAGNEHIAVDSRGAAYICMAFQHSHPSVGSFPDAIEISDRHLLTREDSLACKSCSVDYCLRCVYQNKVDTRECCVSAANVCKLAHVEQRARAALAQEAKQNGCWKADWREPLAPSTLDPFESIEAQREPFMPLWQQPWLTATQPEDVSPGSMLEIIHELEGIVRAVYRCVQENVDIPHNYLLADTPLSRARARTLEGYRDVRFGPGCPTIREIESAALGGTCSERTETCRGADSHSSSCWS
jgi:CXXX repeat peptide maturase